MPISMGHDRDIIMKRTPPGRLHVPVIKADSLEAKCGPEIG
jgi:hypothetical protein